MNIDDIGRVIRTNSIDINPVRVRKRYRHLAIPMLWGSLERRPFLWPRERYDREKRLIEKFWNADLNTPELLNEHYGSMILEWKTLNVTDLVQVFKDRAIYYDEKLQYFKSALELLHEIHNLRETHGDPYFKNFFRLDQSYRGRKGVYTCDFEYKRDSPVPEVTDIMLLTADATKLLDHNHPNKDRATFSIVNEIYGKGIKFPFEPMDVFFYRARFGMRKDFFDYFSFERKTFSLS